MSLHEDPEPYLTLAKTMVEVAQSYPWVTHVAVQNNGRCVQLAYYDEDLNIYYDDELSKEKLTGAFKQQHWQFFNIKDLS